MPLLRHHDRSLFDIYLYGVGRAAGRGDRRVPRLGRRPLSRHPPNGRCERGGAGAARPDRHPRGSRRSRRRPPLATLRLQAGADPDDLARLRGDDRPRQHRLPTHRSVTSIPPAPISACTRRPPCICPRASGATTRSKPTCPCGRCRRSRRASSPLAAWAARGRCTRACVSLWARVLGAVPGSRLLLVAEEHAREPMRRAFGSAGIAGGPRSSSPGGSRAASTSSTTTASTSVSIPSPSPGARPASTPPGWASRSSP